jgi:hypothetical protein
MEYYIIAFEFICSIFNLFMISDNTSNNITNSKSFFCHTPSTTEEILGSLVLLTFRMQYVNWTLSSANSTVFFLIMLQSRVWLYFEIKARLGERRCAYRVLVGKPEGRRPLGRPRG